MPFTGFTMAKMQTKKEKEQFFAELESLGHSGSETESAADGDIHVAIAQAPKHHYQDSETESETDESIYIATENSKARPRPGAKGNAENPVGPSTRRITTIKNSNSSDVEANSRTNQYHAMGNQLPVVIDLITPPGAPLIPSAKHIVTEEPSNSSTKRKRSDNVGTTKRKKTKTSKDQIQMVPEAQRIFKDLVFFFIPHDQIVRYRKERLRTSSERGAKWVDQYDDTVTHVLVESKTPYNEAAKAFPNKQVPDGITIIRMTWWSESLRSGWLRDENQSRFRLLGAPKPHQANEMPRTPSPSANMRAQQQREADARVRTADYETPRRDDQLDEIVECVTAVDRSPLQSKTTSILPLARAAIEINLEEFAADHSAPEQEPHTVTKGFQCMEANDGESSDSPNSTTINALQEMANFYDTTGDQWRTTAYRKAISALRKQKTWITKREQAIKIPQIGTRLAEKIEEIAATSGLRLLENIKDDPYVELLRLFMGVYDVGQKQAAQWISQGHRTLEDLVQKVKLTHNQRVGVEHYEDFKTRISCDEVEHHASFVRRACLSADKSLQVIIGGSYRRGKPDSGDIDLLIMKPGADITHVRTLLNKQVIPALTKAGFLKCALASSSTAGSKWHGASCLPSSTTWRRLDLLFVPWDERGAALLYFTGNDLFNRSMRSLAGTKDMRLNQHGLYKDVMRGPARKKITEGVLVEAASEKKIFQHLGVPWREPWDRNI